MASGIDTSSAYNVFGANDPLAAVQSSRQPCPAQSLTTDVSDNASLWRQARREIKKYYVSCPIQKIAINTWFTKVLNGEFYIGIKGASHDSLENESLITHTDRRYTTIVTFIKELFSQLAMYGFVCYRVVQVEFDTRPHTPMHQQKRFRVEKSSDHVFEVADGENIQVLWNNEMHQYTFFNDGGMTSLDPMDGWNIEISDPFTPCGFERQPLYQSMCSNALNYSIQLMRCHRLYSRRDVLNSIPAVYTNTKDKLTSAGKAPAAQPTLMPQIHSAMASNPGNLYKPYEKDVEQLLDSINGYMEMSSAVRTSKTKQNLETFKTSAGFRSDDPKPVEHLEFFIDEGVNFVDTPARQSQAHHMHMTEWYTNMILYAMRIPPHWIGRSPQSERTAAAAAGAQSAMDNAQHCLTTFVRHLEQCVSTCLQTIGGDDRVQFVIRTCITEHDLEAIKPVVTIDALRYFYACAHRIPMSSLSKEMLKKHQESLVEPKANSFTRDKPAMSNHDKVESQVKRNGPGTEDT